MVRLRSFSSVGIHELSLFCRRGHIGEWSVCVPSLVLGFTSFVLSTRAHRRMVRLRSFSSVGIHELSLVCRRGHIGEWSVCVPSLVLGFTSCRCSVDAGTSANGPSAFLLWRWDSRVVHVGSSDDSHADIGLTLL